MVKRPDLLWMFHRKDLFVSFDGFEFEDGRVVLSDDSKTRDKAACKAIDVRLDDCVIWGGMPVITEAGLVGRISRVSSGSSQVMLLTDSQSAVNAYVQRSRATGVVQGTLGPDLSLEYVLRGETIVVGDVLLTSGVGGNFPRRLVIGQVAEVRQNDIEAHTSAVVVPAANLAELESVLILMNFEPDELLDEP